MRYGQVQLEDEGKKPPAPYDRPNEQSARDGKHRGQGRGYEGDVDAQAEGDAKSVIHEDVPIGIQGEVGLPDHGQVSDALHDREDDASYEENDDQRERRRQENGDANRVACVAGLDLYPAKNGRRMKSALHPSTVLPAIMRFLSDSDEHVRRIDQFSSTFLRHPASRAVFQSAASSGNTCEPRSRIGSRAG